MTVGARFPVLRVVGPAVALLMAFSGGAARAQLPDAPAPPSATTPPASDAPEEPAPTAPESEDVPPPPASAEAEAAPAETTPAPRPAVPPLSPPPEGYAPPAGEGYAYGTETETSQVPVPTRIAARLRTLESDLNLLGARGGGRLADGVISIVAGGAFVTIAAFIDEPLFRSLLFMTAGVALGRGIIDLAVIPDAEDYAIEYSHMPMTTVEQVRERLGYGERTLEMLAKRHRVARTIDGSIAIASGATTIAVFTARPPCSDLRPDCRLKDDPLNFVVIAGGGISIIGGLVGVFTRSEAERRWDAYRKLRKRLSDGAPEDGFELSLPSVSPLRGGAAVHWGMRF